jgi:hypothetical protein
VNTGSPSPKILQLRELLAQKFPAPTLRHGAHLATGIASLDGALGGGLWKGGIVEVVAERPSSGAASLVRGVLAQAAANGLWTALVDGADSFDPHALGASSLARLLWVRCRTAEEALQCTDLLLRDGNLPLVCLDLKANPPAELRRLSGPSWYRLQRMLEPTAIAFLAVTPFALLPCADVRLRLHARFSLAAVEEDPAMLWSQLTLDITRQRHAGDGKEVELLATA